MMKDAWLTDVGQVRPGMNKGLPLPEAIAKAAEIETQIRQPHGRVSGQEIPMGRL